MSSYCALRSKCWSCKRDEDVCSTFCGFFQVRIGLKRAYNNLCSFTQADMFRNSVGISDKECKTMPFIKSDITE